ncbi:hypothetical protein KPL71_021241 [Citrus sinensis]|uniref:Uncharacterized protein n=1 Tax=Citrus sinensis TaxID=2711 RepID=A0ACB8JE95_CITSI|nr:hypothetical protein KPL71_021241 [Citrus sinensis]
MVTRSQHNIFKPKQLHHAITKHPLPEPIEPTCSSQALKDPRWRVAMSDEINALLKNGTWVLVPATDSHNIIECKWVFCSKRNPDGTIARYKARLVAKGFHQRPGLDFQETFSPIIKPTTIRLILSLALSYRWKIRQLDVNNAFLHGTLGEEVFMQQPPGFVDSTYPSHVCKLQKAIYGLKQAPRAWYTELKNFLLSYGFENSQSDTSLFIYKSTNHKYICDLLTKTNLAGAKEVTTPLSTSQPLCLNDGSPLSDATQYRQVIGRLQYLALTRPDISFTVNKLAQFMHQLTETH